MDQRQERFVKVQITHVTQRFHEETRVQKMHAGMLRAADILVHGQDLVDPLAVKRRIRVFVVGIAQKIPAGADECVQCIRITRRVPAAFGALAVHESCVLLQRRLSVRRKVHVIRQLDRQILLGDRQRAAFVAVDDRDRRAPVALSGDQPVSQAVIDLEIAFAAVFQHLGDRVARVIHLHAVELLGIDQHAVVAREGKIVVSVDAADDTLDRQAVFGRELKVALVVSRYRHHGAGAVGRQHIVRHIDRHFFSVHGVDAVRACEFACLFSRRGQTVDLTRLGRHDLIGFHLFPAFVRCDAVDQRILRRQNRVCHTVKRVGTRREYPHRLLASGDLEYDFTSGGAADPVALHLFGLLRPVDMIQAFQKLIRVFGDLQKPLREVLALYHAVAPLAGPVAHDLFVRKHRIAGGAPVDRRFPALRKTVLVHLHEHPLGPLVVIRHAGHHFIIPVEGRAHASELMLHRVYVLKRGILGMDPCFDGIVFCGKTERVKAHGMKHIVSLHALESCPAVRGSVIVPMSRVQFRAGRIGEHLQAVQFFLRFCTVKTVQSRLFPAFAPFFLDRDHIHGSFPHFSMNSK